jgi:hypothetical protein
MKSTFTLLFLVLFYASNYAQETKLNPTALRICSELQNSFISDTKADLALDKILGAIGVSKTFVLQPCNNIDNATAISYRGVRYILYDRDFMYSISHSNDWGNIFILAHEIGHHLNGHSLDYVLYATESVETKSLSQRRIQELEADEFAGFILAKLGGDLNEAIKVINKIAPIGDDTYATHPNRIKRTNAVKKGYASAKQSNQNYNSAKLTKNDLPLTELEIYKMYPNQGCAYWSQDMEMLFNGGNYDVNHPDANRVHSFRCDNFKGVFFASDSYSLSYDVDRYGNVLGLIEENIRDSNGDWLFKIKHKVNGDIEITEY